MVHLHSASKRQATTISETLEWQKGLDFGRKRSISVAAIYGPLGPLTGSRPAGDAATVGLRW
jgi:hypothetical protein